MWLREKKAVHQFFKHAKSQFFFQTNIVKSKALTTRTYTHICKYMYSDKHLEENEPVDLEIDRRHAIDKYVGYP